MSTATVTTIENKCRIINKWPFRQTRPIGRRGSQGRNLFYFRTSLEGWAPRLFREGRHCWYCVSKDGGTSQLSRVIFLSWQILVIRAARIRGFAIDGDKWTAINADSFGKVLQRDDCPSCNKAASLSGVSLYSSCKIAAIQTETGTSALAKRGIATQRAKWGNARKMRRKVRRMHECMYPDTRYRCCFRFLWCS